MQWLRLIRWPNLVLLAFTQCVMHYGFLYQQPFPLALSHGKFALLVLASVILAAGGYLLNNFYDVDTDTRNGKFNPIDKTIDRDTVFNCYMACNVIGLGLGFYLSNYIGFNSFTGIFVIVSATLYLYSDSFQYIPVVKNVTIALLVAISVLLVPAFDLIPLMGQIDRGYLETLGAVALDYALFTFLLNLLREIVKDIQDINGDYNSGNRTLPVLLGINRTRNWAIALAVMAILSLIYYAYSYLTTLFVSSMYLAVAVAFPLCIVITQLYQAKKPQHFHRPATLLKWIMLLGVLSIALIQWEINHPILSSLF